MNFSCIALSSILRAENAPFITQPSFKSSSHLSFNRFRFKRQFSSFIYSKTNFHLSIFSSKFQSHLRTVVKLSNVEYSGEKYSISKKTNDPIVTFVDCSFIGCNTDGSGGAINAQNKCNLTIQNCIFSECKSEGYGGAIKASTDVYSISSSCFTYCYARSDGQSLHIENSRDTANDCELHDNSFQYCADDEYKSNGIGLLINSGRIKFGYNNHTDSITSRGWSCMSVRMAVVESISFSNIKNCTSPGVLEMYFMKSDVRFEKCNIIANEVTRSVGLLSFSSDTYFIDCFFLQNGKPLTALSPGKPYTVYFQNCIYDAFSFEDTRNIVTKDCRNIGAKDFPISAGPQNAACKSPEIAPNNTNVYIIIAFIVGLVCLVLLILTKTSVLKAIYEIFTLNSRHHRRRTPVTRI